MRNTVFQIRVGGNIAKKKNFFCWIGDLVLTGTAGGLAGSRFPAGVQCDYALLLAVGHLTHGSEKLVVFCTDTGVAWQFNGTGYNQLWRAPLTLYAVPGTGGSYYSNINHCCEAKNETLVCVDPAGFLHYGPWFEPLPFSSSVSFATSVAFNGPIVPSLLCDVSHHLLISISISISKKKKIIMIMPHSLLFFF